MSYRAPDPPQSSTAGGVVVRPLDDPHRRFAAELHRSALPSGLFPRLGLRFLISYHAAFEQSPYGVALIASAAGEPVGMLMGTTDGQAHQRWVARHRGGRMARAGIIALLCRPTLAVLFVRTRARRYLVRLLRLRRTSTTTERTAGACRETEEAVGNLTHIAVSPAYHGAGIGSTLVNAYVRAAERAGTKLLAVVTSQQGPEAVGFYERLGWETTGETVDFDDNPYVRLIRRMSG